MNNSPDSSTALRKIRTDHAAIHRLLHLAGRAALDRRSLSFSGLDSILAPGLSIGISPPEGMLWEWLHASGYCSGGRVYKKTKRIVGVLSSWKVLIGTRK